MGERLREVRDGRELSLRQAAELAGVNYATLGTWERGMSYPPADALVRLATAYGVTPNSLLGFPDSFMGIPLVDQWPEGLMEFVTSDLAAAVKLRPWEVAVLAGLVQEGAATDIGQYLSLLVSWRNHYFDDRGLDALAPPTEKQESS